MLDVEGNEHFIVLRVNDLLWAFSVREGTSETRSVYCIWFEGTYRQVWIKELPDTAYERPSDTACMVVGSLALIYDSASRYFLLTARNDKQ